MRRRGGGVWSAYRFWLAAVRQRGAEAVADTLRLWAERLDLRREDKAFLQLQVEGIAATLRLAEAAAEAWVSGAAATFADPTPGLKALAGVLVALAQGSQQAARARGAVLST